MLGAQTDDIARDLLEFGEPEAAEWVQKCTDDELVKVCSVADWLCCTARRQPPAQA